MLAQFRRTGTLPWLLLLLLCSVGWSQRAEVGRRRGEPRESAEPTDEMLVTKVYRVIDIVLPTPNYSFQGVQLPGMDARNGNLIRQGGMGGMGGGGGMGGFGGGGMGGGGMGGGGMGGFGGGGNGAQGGGMFNVAPDHVLNQMAAEAAPKAVIGRDGLQITMDDLIETIVTTIRSGTWDDVGGEGSITSIGGLLVIQQIPSVHAQISQLLGELRENGAVPQSVTLRALWLSVESDAIVKLGEANPRRISKELLQKHAEDVVARAQITCFDSQTVHLVAGRLRSLLSSFIPVVGQNQATAAESAVATATGTDPGATIPDHVFAQVAAGGGESSIVREGGGRVGYQPVTQSVNLGMLLQVTPLLVANGQSVALDVHSIAVSPEDESVLGDFHPGGMRLDRLDVTSQQFRTTLRMPLRTPILIGGMTMRPTAGKDDRQLLLIMEVWPE